MSGDARPGQPHVAQPQADPSRAASPLASQPESTPFGRAIALRADGAGWRCELLPAWRQGPGVFGGVQAALLLEAATRTVAEPARRVRTLAVNFVARATPGPATLRVDVVRRGRTLSHVQASLRRGDAVVAVAAATFARARSPASGASPSPPGPAPHWSTLPESRHGSQPPQFTELLCFRDCFGSPYVGADHAVVGGWGRFAAATALTAPAIAALADAWPPAQLARARSQVAVASADLRIHFHHPGRTPMEPRSNAPSAAPAEPGWVLYRGETVAEHEGFADESATLWAEDGRLLATVRQSIVSFGAPR